MQSTSSNIPRSRRTARTHDTPSTTLSRLEALRESLGLARIVSSLNASREETAEPACGRFPGRLATPHILLIDPDFDTLDHIGHVLGKQGFGVTRSSVLLDIACIERIAPDVIVLTADLDHAAVALGFVQAGMLRSTLRGTPIIHTTACPDLAGSLREGSLIALEKPYTPDALLRLIDTVMAGRTARSAVIDDQSGRHGFAGMPLPGTDVDVPEFPRLGSAVESGDFHS